MPDNHHLHLGRALLCAALAGCTFLLAVPVGAQQVQDIRPSAEAQPQLIDLPASGTASTGAQLPQSSPLVSPVDLGQASEGNTTPGAQAGVAARAAAAARDGAAPAIDAPRSATSGAKAAGRNHTGPAKALAAQQDRVGVERAVFARQPVRVGLPVQRERLITLPGPAALHVPRDIESVARIEAIDRTIYVTALVPFAPIRIVAELIDGGKQIPLDLVANPQTSGASAELEVFLDKAPARDAATATQGDAQAGPPAADMVELTRFASRMLYAPRRLATSRPGIQQVQVSNKPVPGLVRGGLVETVPLGQWRSAGLYVTAVRVTNKSTRPFELPLEHLRGRWLAVTAQHGRIGPAGTETDTTALYLICDRAFDACL